MKKCPGCNIIYTEKEYNACPMCGMQLVSDYEHSRVNIGHDNTFTGGVHSTVDNSKSNSENVANSYNTTTNHTTIYEAVKSKSERLEADIQKYRLTCKEFYHNGLISEEGERQLLETQKALHLADELAVPIKEEIRQQSRKRISPTLSVINGIHQTKSIIEQNSDASLRRQLSQLESWMEEYNDDTLKLMYYQLSAILEPERFTRRYENSAKNEYWEVFWAFIAYLLRHDEKHAYIAHASLGRLQANYPEQNDAILRLAGQLMLDAPIEAINLEREGLTANYSRELKLLLDAIDELLHNDWTNRNLNIRPIHSFYINTLFTNFVTTQKTAGEGKRKELERINRAEQQRISELKRQKEFLLQKFEETGEIEKACAELNIPYLTFRSWLEDDLIFNSSYYELVRKIDRRRAEHAEKARIAQEIESRTRQQKSHFIPLYEQNNCNLFKTCSDLDIKGETVDIWRKSDKAFDGAVTAVEHEHEEKLDAARKRILKERLKKSMIYVGIGLLILIGIVCFQFYSNRQAMQNEARSNYSEAVAAITHKLKAFPTTTKEVSIERDFAILNECVLELEKLKQMEQTEHLDGLNESYQLSKHILDKAEILRQYSNDMATDPDSPELHSIGQDYAIRIDELKQHTL